MKNLFMILSLINCLIFASTNDSNIQDSPQISNALTGPLHKIKHYNLNTYFSSTRNEEISIKKNMIAELKKIGIVNVIDSLNPLDFEKFSDSANLIFKIDDLKNIKNASGPILRASLNVETDVQIKLSKGSCSCYIWSSNFFIEGDLAKDKAKTILDSFKKLIADFQTDLKNQNKESDFKIVFNVLD